jgi:hypothetical protein
MLAPFKRHPDHDVYRAHIGVGRIIRPVKDQTEIVERSLGTHK